MEEKFNWEVEGFVAVWIGNFDSIVDFESYLEESIGEDSDASEPLNRFAADIGFGFYDHDFQEVEFFQTKLKIEKLFEPFSYSQSFLNEAVNAARDKQIKEANAVFLLYDCEYKLKTLDDAPILFVGNFKYEK